jgi:hypothetical protein
LKAGAQPKHISKNEKAEERITSLKKVEAEVKKIYDFSKAAWCSAVQRHKLEHKSRMQHMMPAGFTADESFPLLDAPLASRPNHHNEVMTDLQASVYSAPWKIFGSWRGSSTAVTVEIDDPYLGRLCRGRLALVRGDAVASESAWQSLAADFPKYIEPHVELWQLHTSQGAHKKAVLDIRRAVELITSGRSDWGKYIQVPIDLLINGKTWPGAEAPLGIEDVVHILLAKSLKRCRLWDQAWVSLCNGHDAMSSSAHGAFAYQMGKLSIQYLQEFLTMQLRDLQQLRSSIEPEIESAASDARPTRTLEGSVSAENIALMQMWLERGQKCLQEFSKHQHSEDEMRKGAHYIARFESCAQLIGRLRPGVDAVQEAGATSGNEPPVTETGELSLHQVHADASSLPNEVDELSRQTAKEVD